MIKKTNFEYNTHSVISEETEENRKNKLFLDNMLKRMKEDKYI